MLVLLSQDGTSIAFAKAEYLSKTRAEQEKIEGIMKAYVDRLVYYRHHVIARCLTMISLFRHDLRSTVTLQHTYKKLRTMTGILPKCISLKLSR